MTHTDQTKSATTYTPGPWDYDTDYIVAPDPDGRHPDIYIAEIAHSDDEGRIASPQQQDANRRLIATAPELLEALQGCLFALDVNSDGSGPTKNKAIAKALAALTKASGSFEPARRKAIVIEVRGGVVQEVLNVPPGYEYEVTDYDNIETDGDAA